MTLPEHPAPHLAAPGDDNEFQAPHIDLLCASYRRWTDRELIAANGSPRQRAEAVWSAPFVVASHDTQADPVFNYANLAALTLWEMDWANFTRLPSRYSAEAVAREERERLLAAVASHGFIDDYRGVRITASGRRFRIEQATVWNVIDAADIYHGQAVMFDRWTFL